tara:strand:- start:205 stop:648 length:444 start_codon:yes stop_codon:yes gene_type:complete
MPIKSFRGKIADGSIDTISLHTNNGAVGYRIKKLQLLPAVSAAADVSMTLKIYSIPQTTATDNIDFSDNTLLGVAILNNATASNDLFSDKAVFDNMIFNQDIYITYTEGVGTVAGNYYIELEQIKLDLNDNTMATLKDIKNIEASYL